MTQMSITSKIYVCTKCIRIIYFNTFIVIYIYVYLLIKINVVLLHKYNYVITNYKFFLIIILHASTNGAVIAYFRVSKKLF